MEERKKNSYWLSWEHKGKYGSFTLDWPWWISGSGSGYQSICAAVRASNEEEAKEIVLKSFDERPKEEITWRFVNDREDGWSPFCERFPKADWMVW
jgi:hypothetical protein